MAALRGLQASCSMCQGSTSLRLSTPCLSDLRPFVGRLSPRQVSLSRGRAAGPVALKKDIHPEYYEEAKVFCNGEEVLTVSGTKKSYTVDVWSGNHPFFTGSNQALIVDEGRVNKFQKRFQGLSLGTVAPVAAGGNKKLEYKTEKDKKKKGKR